MSAATNKRVRIFYCLPTEALADPELTALDHRGLGVIALHDGMSKVKGNGAGCYASYKTLAAIIGTDITNFSKVVSKLLRLGYITREPQQNDKRRFTLRVEYRTNIVGEITNNPDEVVGEANNQKPKVVGEADFESRRNPDVSDAYYISLKEELNSEEPGEIDSDESARLKRGANYESITETAEILRRLERDIKGNCFGYAEDQLLHSSEWLLETSEFFAAENGNLSQWANRLHDDLNFIIEQREERRLYAQPF